MERDRELDRCQARTRRGRQCQRLATRGASDGSRRCAGHDRVDADRADADGSKRGERGEAQRGLYRPALSAEEQLDAALAAASDGLDEEIAMLRLNFRRALAQGDVWRVADASRALVAAVRARHQMADRSDGSLNASLGRVLAELGAEAGTEL